MTDLAKSLPCIVCGVELDDVSGYQTQPYEGLSFTTQGHYGSTYFDPMDGSRLAINICDPCVKAAQANGKVKGFGGSE